MQRGERSRHTRSRRTNRMLRLTTRRLLLYTVPLRPFEFPTTVSLSLSLSIPLASTLSPSLSRTSIYLYSALAPASFAHLSLSSFRARLPLHLPSPLLDHPFSLARSLLVSIYLSFCLSYPLCSPFSFFVYSARRTVAPSRSRLHRTCGAPADFAFKFGKFAGVGK